MSKTVVGARSRFYGMVTLFHLCTLHISQSASCPGLEDQVVDESHRDLTISQSAILAGLVLL